MVTPKTTRKKTVATPRKAAPKKAVPAVLQPDGDSCGWTTTLWLLQKFDRLDYHINQATMKILLNIT